MYSKTIEQIIYSSNPQDEKFILSKLPKELIALYKLGTDSKLYNVKSGIYDPGDWGCVFDICISSPWIDQSLLREFIESDYKDKSFELTYPHLINETRVLFAQMHVQGHEELYYDFKTGIISMGEYIKRPRVVIKNKFQLKKELINYYKSERAEVQSLIDAGEDDYLNLEIEFIDKLISKINLI